MFALRRTYTASRGVVAAVCPRRRFWTSQEVANKGSLARDILATERTFLAWARTGLGFVGAGSALAAAYHRQDQRLAPAILPASALLMGNGAFLLLFATRRYYTVLEALRRDKFVINTFDTLFAVGLTSVTTVASLAIVWRAEFLKGPRKTSSKSSRRRKEKRSSSSSSSSSSSETPSESSSDAEGPSR